MVHYRLYRLRTNNSIIDALDIDAHDDEAAMAKAVEIDHAPLIEVWCGTRMVSRVAPQVLKIRVPPV